MSVQEITTDKLRTMNDQEGLILQGCGGDLQEWVIVVHITHESCSEVDGVAYRPGVYKMSMVRMFPKN